MSEVGAALWDRALNLQGLCWFQVVSVKTKLQDTQLVSGVLENCLVWNNPHTFGVRCVVSKKQQFPFRGQMGLE